MRWKIPPAIHVEVVELRHFDPGREEAHRERRRPRFRSRGPPSRSTTRSIHRRQRRDRACGRVGAGAGDRGLERHHDAIQEGDHRGGESPELAEAQEDTERGDEAEVVTTSPAARSQAVARPRHGRAEATLRPMSPHASSGIAPRIAPMSCGHDVADAAAGRRASPSAGTRGSRRD